MYKYHLILNYISYIIFICFWPLLYIFSLIDKNTREFILRKLINEPLWIDNKQNVISFNANRLNRHYHIVAYRKSLWFINTRLKILSILKYYTSDYFWKININKLNNNIKNMNLIEYPSYYKQPYHDIIGGYLSSYNIYYEHSKRTYLNSIKHGYDELSDINIINIISKHYKQKNTNIILDIGCSIAEFSVKLRNKFDNSNVIGLDCCPYFYFINKELFGKLDRIEFLYENFENSSVKEESVDMIVAISLVHELPANATTNLIKISNKLLKKDGLFIISELKAEEFKKRFNVFEPYMDSYANYDFDKNINNNNFKIIESTEAFENYWVKVCKKHNSEDEIAQLNITEK
jgi:ubiquinone/menaquinone biosynthesis C-methylase UbiE